MGFLKNSEVIEQNVNNKVRVYREIAPAMEQYGVRMNLARGLDINPDTDDYMKRLQDRTYIVSLLKTMTTEPNNVYTWLWQNDFIQVFLKYYNEFHNYILKRFLSAEEFKTQFRLYYDELLNKKGFDVRDMNYINNEADYLAYKDYGKENPLRYTIEEVKMKKLQEQFNTVKDLENKIKELELITGNRTKQSGNADPELNENIKIKNKLKKELAMLRKQTEFELNKVPSPNERRFMMYEEAKRNKLNEAFEKSMSDLMMGRYTTKIRAFEKELNKLKNAAFTDAALPVRESMNDSLNEQQLEELYDAIQDILNQGNVSILGTKKLINYQNIINEMLKNI